MTLLRQPYKNNTVATTDVKDNNNNISNTHTMNVDGSFTLRPRKRQADMSFYHSPPTVMQHYHQQHHQHHQPMYGNTAAPHYRRSLRAAPFEFLVHKRVGGSYSRSTLSPTSPYHQTPYAPPYHTTHVTPSSERRTVPTTPPLEVQPKTSSGNTSSSIHKPPIEEIRIPTPPQDDILDDEDNVDDNVDDEADDNSTVDSAEQQGSTIKRRKIDYESLYLQAQHDLHRCQHQVMMVEHQNRSLQRNLIEMQRQMFEFRRTRSTSSSWEVPNNDKGSDDTKESTDESPTLPRPVSNEETSNN